MDTDQARQLPGIPADFDWEGFHRRNNPCSPWYDPSLDVPQNIGTNQDTGDDVGRRERMAQAMYEC